jgi:hypothetical protein
VPGKIQEFLLVIFNVCALAEKIQGMPCVSAFNKKKQNISITFQLILEFFKV